MIRISYEQIIEKIKEKADISDKEIENKIQEKMNILSGLISKEGAAHIVANELGIRLFEPPKGGLKIKDILIGMRSLAIAGKVQKRFPVAEFTTENRQGRVGSFVMGDETGVIRVVLWNNQADKLGNIKEGDIVKIEEAYVRDNNGRTEAHLGEKGLLRINPKGIEIKGVKQEIAERKKLKDLTENDNDVEILGTVVQVYNPNFFEVCPDCGKRAKMHHDNFVCDEHNVVNPDFSYVCNIFLDDGTENIRCVFFRQQAEQLLKKTREELLAYREAPEKFEEIKTGLLGNIIKLQGRVVKNQMFDRLEFIANAVLEANPEEELKRLEAEKIKKSISSEDKQ